MFRSNTLGFVLVVGLALIALFFIFQWQTNGAISMPSLGGDGRMVEQIGSKRMHFRPSDLQPGDTILAINGIAVNNANDVFKVLEALYQPGLETLQVSVRRIEDNGRVDTKTVELARDRIATLRLRGGRPDTASSKPTAEALYAAAESGNATAVEQILDSGGKAFIDDIVHDQTALIAAVSKGNTEAVRVLLDYKADVNKPAADQTTALMRAAELGNRDLVAALMVAGADPSLRNSQLQTASDIAADQGFLDIADFIDHPSPTKFLNADQRRKIVEPLRNMGVLKSSGYRPSDAELFDAIKAYQRQAGLPVSGIVTSDTFEDLVKYSIRAMGSKNDQQVSETTKTTLARLFSRALNQQWTPVGSSNGYPQCDEENVRFEISPDQQTITWKSYRPGATADDIASGVKPTQTASFRVRWADQRDGNDAIMVQPDPRPITGPAYQLWEIRDGSMTISLQTKPETDSSGSAGLGDAIDAGFSDTIKGESSESAAAGQSRDDDRARDGDRSDGNMGLNSSDTGSASGRKSFLVMCHS